MRENRFAKQKKLGIVPANAVLSPRDPGANPWDDLPEEKRKDLAHRMAVYAAQVDSIDQNVGKLVAKLKELGQFENTLILFLSDNGCSAEGGPGGFSRGKEGAPVGSPESYASVGLEWANVSDTPFRKFKTDTYEGGTATPLIAHWPAGISDKGGLRHQTGHVIDIMPTLVELSGAAYPEEAGGKAIVPMEGESLVSLFKNDSEAPRELFWEHLGNKAVRSGDWKAVTRTDKPWKLYNLATDPTETRDLAKAEPGKATELAAIWKAWAKRCGVLELSELKK